MSKQGMRVHREVVFYLLPIALVVSDFFAVCTNGEKTAQCVDMLLRGPQVIRDLPFFFQELSYFRYNIPGYEKGRKPYP